MLVLLQRPRFLMLMGVMGLVVAGGVHLAAATFTPAQPPAARAPAAPLPAILVAARPLPPGHRLGPGDTRALAWPQGQPPAGSLAATDATMLQGARTRRALAAGEWLAASALVPAGERGFLAAVVPPGQRAITIAVDATTAASGLILPGDRVDVILTQEFRDDRVAVTRRVLAEIVLADMQVLAADQRLAPAEATHGERGPVPATVTLAATPAQAQTLAVAATLGRLHLALRGVESAPGPVAAPALWAGQVSPGLAGVPRRVAGNALPELPAALAAPTAALAAPPSVLDAVPVFRGTGELAK